MSEHREHQPAGRRTYRIAGINDRSAAPSLSQGHVDDLVAPYALGALEPDEIAAVDAHIRGCPACERALQDAQCTAGMLSFTVPLYTPPADTKAALFARVGHAQKAAAASALPTQNLTAFRTPTLPSSMGIDDSAPAPRTAAAVVDQPRSESRTGWLVSVVSVPLLIALVATGFWGLQLRNQLSTQSSQLAEMQAELTNFGSGTTSYQLSPGEAAPQAQGQIVMGADQRSGMVQIDANTDEGPKTYEMWVMNQDGQLRPVSELEVNQDGIGQARFELDQPFSEYESVHIRAKPVDAAVDSSQFDTLYQENGGPLGSTGSGLDIGP